MKKLLILLFRILFNRKSKEENIISDGENIKRVPYNSGTKDIFKVKIIDGATVLYEKGKKWNGRLELIYENGDLESVGKIENGQKEGTMKKFFIKSLNGMAFGLFSSLIVGLILKQIGILLKIDFLTYLGNFSQLLMGAGIGVGISYTLEAPVLILIASAITGMYGAGSIHFVNGEAILKAGEPMGAYFSVIFGLLIAKQVVGKTKFDIILLPIITIILGCLLGKFFSPYISTIIADIGLIVNKTTELNPILMGLTMSVIMGIILTLPISSAAIGISLGLSGLAAGASLTGCCCQMIGFAVMSYDDNDIGTVFSIAFGTSMIQIPNIIKNPIIWIPPIVSSAILGVLSTSVFNLSSNSIASGMGTSGFVGQIATFSVNGLSYLPTMIILHFLLPAILNMFLYKILKKKGYIKVGDLKI